SSTCSLRTGVRPPDPAPHPTRPATLVPGTPRLTRAGRAGGRVRSPREGDRMGREVVARYRRWFDYEQDAHAKVLSSLDTVPADRRAAPECRRAVALFARIVAGRRVWLYRLGAAPAPPGPLFPDNPGLDEVAAEWQSVRARWADYLARADDGELA